MAINYHAQDQKSGWKKGPSNIQELRIHKGPGRLLGATTVIDAISGVAAINVLSTGQPGEIGVTASSLGLEPGFAHLQAR